jgi:hypothetical protein
VMGRPAYFVGTRARKQKWTGGGVGPFARLQTPDAPRTCPLALPRHVQQLPQGHESGEESFAIRVTECAPVLGFYVFWVGAGCGGAVCFARELETGNRCVFVKLKQSNHACVLPVLLY